MGKIKEFVKSNKWVLLASLVLLIWKLLLVQTLWHERLIPPEPDDSYIYVAHIESVKKCPSIFFCEKPIYPMTSFGGYSHLSYRLFLGYLALIFNLTSEQAFHLGFYIGSFLLIPVLWTFLKSIGFKDHSLAFAFLFALLPHGGSGMHSFSWMVPSYFALLLIMLIFSFIIGDYKRWKLWIAITVPLAIYTHTISVYLLAIPFIYVVILFFWERKINKQLLIKLGFSAIVAIAVYAPVSFYLSQTGKTVKGNPYGVENFLKNSVKEHAQEVKKI